MFDAAAAAEVCELISFTELLKASPVEESGHRYLFIEASNESVDYAGEIVLARALADSSDYFLRYGNIDLDHVTVTGPRRGPADYALYEIGRPVEVKASRSRTFVKAELFQGDAPTALNANLVWASMTAQKPPQRWFPSVGGAVLEKSQEVAPDGSKRTVVTRVRWANIGLSKTPVNLTVPQVSIVPFGVLAKSSHGAGFDLAKALSMAGAGSDVAALSGGAALQRQSLDRKVQSYFDFRENASKALREGRAHPNARSLIGHATDLGLDPDEASEWAQRFLADVARRRASPSPTQPKQKEAARG